MPSYILLIISFVIAFVIVSYLIWQQRKKESDPEEDEGGMTPDISHDFFEESHFWGIIQKSRIESEGLPDEQLDLLRKELKLMDAGKLIRFQNTFNRFMNKAYSWEVYGAAWLIYGVCSDHEFELFRAWLVSQGRIYFEKVTADPQLIGDEVPSALPEGLATAAADVYFAKFGTMPVNLYPSAGDLAGEAWEERELKSRFPDLARKFSK